jgi:hypothetical protein
LVVRHGRTRIHRKGAIATELSTSETVDADSAILSRTRLSWGGNPGNTVSNPRCCTCLRHVGIGCPSRSAIARGGGQIDPLSSQKIPDKIVWSSGIGFFLIYLERCSMMNPTTRPTVSADATAPNLRPEADGMCAFAAGRPSVRSEASRVQSRPP